MAGKRDKSRDIIKTLSFFFSSITLCAYEIQLNRFVFLTDFFNNNYTPKTIP